MPSASSSRICLIGNQAFSLVNFRGPLIADMIARGHQVIALAPDYDDNTREAVKALGAEPVDYSLSRTGMNPLRDLTDTLRLALLLRRLRPDVAFGYAIKPVIYGTLAARIARVPRRFAMIEGLGYAFTLPDGREPLKRRALRGMVSILYATALGSPSRVFFLNGDDIDEFTRSHLVSPKKASLLGGIGVELEKWPPAPPVTRPVTFLLAARLLREKGIVEYATAARLVRSRHPEARFILLGGLDSNPGALSRDEIET